MRAEQRLTTIMLDSVAGYTCRKHFAAETRLSAGREIAACEYVFDITYAKKPMPTSLPPQAGTRPSLQFRRYH